ncbi:MAG TPA: hypothetical protein VFW65_26780 [Pseudonocardiaceae bacterium]|nr:hypothetical protein [Pseudonocardiaceae bacterium]
MPTLSGVDDGGAVVIAHGGGIEPVLVGPRGWGPAMTHCDGASLTFDDGRRTGIRIRRAATRI